MSLDEGVSNFIKEIYASAHEPAAWDTTLRRLLEKTRSYCIEVSAIDLRAVELVDANFYGPDEARFLDGIRDYRTELYKINPCLPFGDRHPYAGVVTLPIALAQEGRDYQDHPFTRWMKDVMGSALAVCLYTPAIDGLTFSMARLPRADLDPHDDDLRLFHLLFGHFENAMRLVARPVDFESAEDARLLLNDQGRVRVMSEAARILLEQRDGLAVKDGRLLAGGREDARRLDALLRSAHMDETMAGRAILIQRPSGRRPWVVFASPVPNPPSPFEGFRSATAVRIVDPAAASGSDPLPWVSAFGLTRTEARLAEALLTSDASLREIANNLGMAYATARVHLAHIFEKVGVRSQMQLIRALTRIGA